MQIIHLDEAREMGFEPRDYSQYPPIGEVFARIDFIAWIQATEAVFFREEKTGARYYLALQYAAEPGVMSPHAMNAFFPYVRRGDLCQFITFQNRVGGYCLCGATLIEQVPVCHWSEQCAKRSPCCVFKN